MKRYRNTDRNSYHTEKYSYRFPGYTQTYITPSQILSRCAQDRTDVYSSGITFSRSARYEAETMQPKEARTIMNIAIMAHDNKKELMVQFCTAYAGILSRHQIYATNTTGHMVAEATGLNVHCFLTYAHGGSQQIGAHIAYNEIDLVLFFNDPNDEEMAGENSYLSRLCDKNNIPFATNIATAEMLVLGLARGDLDWRCIVNPSTKPIA